MTTSWLGRLVVAGVAVGCLATPAWANDEGLIPEGSEIEAEPAPPEAPTSDGLVPEPAAPVPASPSAPMAPGAPVVARAPGRYAGVVPGRAPDGAVRRKRPTRPSVTWIGYQPKDGAARLFVETSVPVTYEQVTQGDVVTVTIPGVRLASKNVGRRLDLSAFEGPIASVDVKQLRGRAGISLRVKLRAGGKQPAVMNEPDPSGYHYLFLDFGL